MLQPFLIFLIFAHMQTGKKFLHFMMTHLLGMSKNVAFSTYVSFFQITSQITSILFIRFMDFLGSASSSYRYSTQYSFYFRKLHDVCHFKDATVLFQGYGLPIREVYYSRQIIKETLIQGNNVCC